MKKKKKLLVFTFIFTAVLVFVIFYFKDNTDVAKIEKKQDASAIETADDLLDDLNASFEDMDFEEFESDSLANDSII